MTILKLQAKQLSTTPLASFVSSEGSTNQGPKYEIEDQGCRKGIDGGEKLRLLMLPVVRLDRREASR